MKRKTVYALPLILLTLKLYAQNYNPESHFTIIPLPDGTARIVAYIGTWEEVVIPPIIQGMAVNEIGYRAFQDKNITNIIAPSVISIGTEAFRGCRQLTIASFPLVNSIDRSAFKDLRNLDSVSFPLAENIGIEAFRGSNRLTIAYFPMATTISRNAFKDCDMLARVTLGTIKSGNFSINSFRGNIRDVYFATGGGAGTYFREPPSREWKKE